MKSILLGCFALLIFTGCSDQSKSAPQMVAENPDFTAPLHKDDEGISLCGATKESIGLQTAFVAERKEGAETILAVPKSAVMNTTSGDSVYVENGEYFKRSTVKVGRSFGDLLEITEGVYDGDIIVTNGAQTLWLVELRAVKGGKGCCPMPDAKKA
jgi:hypothetical protein